MRGGLWLIRLLLLVAVSAVVFSPLVVHGEASTPHQMDLDYDVSSLALPSSPTYPAVTAYREVRMALADGPCDKARTSLSFADDDAAAILELASRQRYVDAAEHAAVFRQNFDCSVGWAVIAGQNGTNVAAVLNQLKNEHLGQQIVFTRADALLPEWAAQGLGIARQHAASVLLEAITVLEGEESAADYRNSLEQLIPDIVLDLPAAAPAGESTEQEEAEQPAVFGDQQIAAGEDTADTPQPEQVAPDIASISVRPSVVAPGETCRISCNVISGSTDVLMYTWSSQKGELDAGGAHADWTAPSKEGSYLITVVVMDRDGNSDQASVQVRVRGDADNADDGVGDSSASAATAPQSSASPDILDMSVTADHKYLEEAGTGYAILIGRSCTITCVVDDPDAVSFEWSCTAGDYQGNGDTIVWDAPHGPGNYRVNVVVTNGEGEEDTAEVYFHVTTCSQCF